MLARAWQSVGRTAVSSPVDKTERSRKPSAPSLLSLSFFSLLGQIIWKTCGPVLANPQQHTSYEVRSTTHCCIRSIHFVRICICFLSSTTALCTSIHLLFVCVYISRSFEVYVFSRSRTRASAQYCCRSLWDVRSVTAVRTPTRPWYFIW